MVGFEAFGLPKGAMVCVVCVCACVCVVTQPLQACT
jgi:hypothetical protein